MKTDNVMKRWLAVATPTQRKRLANLAKTTEGTLRQIAGGYRTRGKLQVSADLAAALEKASKQVSRQRSDHVLPQLWRTDLCPACGRCEFAKACGH